MVYLALDSQSLESGLLNVTQPRPMIMTISGTGIVDQTQTGCILLRGGVTGLVAPNLSTMEGEWES